MLNYTLSYMSLLTVSIKIETRTCACPVSLIQLQSMMSISFLYILLFELLYVGAFHTITTYFYDFLYRNMTGITARSNQNK